MKKSFKNLMLVSALTLAATAAFGATKASAALSYHTTSGSDAIISSNEDGYYAVLKKSDTAKVKTSSFKSIASKTPIDLAKTLKIAETKDGYFYFVTTKPTADVEVAPNFTIAKSPYSKITVTLDYTALDLPSRSAIALVTGKKDGTDEVIYKKDSSKITMKSDTNAAKILWSTDSKSWYAANDSTKFDNGFDAAMMKANLNKTVYFKVAAVGNARPSKAAKVKIAKPARAPSVKLDVNKLSINIKNGYDFVVSSAAASNTKVWYSLLPYNKDATPSTEAASILATSTFSPLDKKSDAAKTVYTTYKFKSLSIDTLLNKVGLQKSALTTPGTIFYVRKSATNKKPASDLGEIKISIPAKKPSIASTGPVTFVTSEAIAFSMPSLTKDKDDTAETKFEYAVVNKSDIANIDFTTVRWKSAKAGTKITEKSKTKYKLKDASDAEAFFSETTVIYVRRKGVSKKGNYVLPSEMGTINIVKSGTEYQFKNN